MSDKFLNAPVNLGDKTWQNTLVGDSRNPGAPGVGVHYRMQTRLCSPPDGTANK